MVSANAVAGDAVASGTLPGLGFSAWLPGHVGSALGWAVGPVAALHLGSCYLPAPAV